MGGILRLALDGRLGWYYRLLMGYWGQVIIAEMILASEGDRLLYLRWEVGTPKLGSMLFQNTVTYYTRTIFLCEYKRLAVSLETTIKGLLHFLSLYA